MCATSAVIRPSLYIGRFPAAGRNRPCGGVLDGEHIPEWGEIRDGHLKPSEARAEFVHCHAVGFWALATAGKALIEAYPDEVNWKARMSMLEKIDWRKANSDWQGICMLG